MKENKLHVIAKIDKKIYGIDELNTDEVVITEERMNHIKEHHPEVFELIMDNLKETIENPDIVYEEINQKDTRWAIKRLSSDNLRVIVKLSTNKDMLNWKNSVITTHVLSKKRLNNYCRQDKIKFIYKSSK